LKNEIKICRSTKTTGGHGTTKISKFLVKSKSELYELVLRSD